MLSYVLPVQTYWSNCFGTHLWMPAFLVTTFSHKQGMGMTGLQNRSRPSCPPVALGTYSIQGWRIVAIPPLVPWHMYALLFSVAIDKHSQACMGQVIERTGIGNPLPSCPALGGSSPKARLVKAVQSSRPSSSYVMQCNALHVTVPW